MTGKRGYVQNAIRIAALFKAPGGKQALKLVA
jgi:hypothetical protein